MLRDLLLETFGLILTALLFYTQGIARFIFLQFLDLSSILLRHPDGMRVIPRLFPCAVRPQGIALRPFAQRKRSDRKSVV